MDSRRRKIGRNSGAKSQPITSTNSPGPTTLPDLGGSSRPNIDVVVVEVQPTTDVTREEVVTGNTDAGDESMEEEEDNILDKVPRAGFDSDISEDEQGRPPALVKDSRHRLIIHPKGDSFLQKKEVLAFIRTTIHSFFEGPWNSFSKVPPDSKKLWWTEFENTFCWEDRHATRIKANWKTKCSNHIRNRLFEAHKHDIKPPFVSTEHWAEMKEERASDYFKNCSETNKRNRASKGPDGTAIYTGGSRSVAENVYKIESDTKKRMTQKELVKSMYHSNKTGQWTGDRPPTCLDRFKQLCGTWLESNPGEAIPQQVVNKLWFQAARGEKKGRVCGQGSLYRKCDKVMNPPARDPSPRTTDLSPPTASDSANPASTPALAPSPSPQPTTTDLPSLPSRAPDFTPRAATQPTNDQTALQRQVDQLKEMFGTQMEQQAATIQQLRLQLQQEQIKNMSQGSQIVPSNMSFQALMASTSIPPGLFGEGNVFGDGSGGRI